MSFESGTRTADIAPLALLSWSSESNNYMDLLSTIESECSSIDDLALREFSISCLRGKLAHDADSNNKHLANYLPKIGTSAEQDVFINNHTRDLGGVNTPYKQVAFLHDHLGIESTEIARRTHVGSWDTYENIDREVRSSLDENGLDTAADKDADARYKIRQFSEELDMNRLRDASSLIVGVERKRKVRSHFGGRIVTVAKNFLVLDTHPVYGMPEELSAHLYNLDHIRRKTPKQFSYTASNRTVKLHLEPHIESFSSTDKPEWATPLVTTYYSFVTSDPASTKS